MLSEQENMREIPKKYIFAIPGTAPSKSDHPMFGQGCLFVNLYKIQKRISMQVKLS